VRTSGADACATEYAPSLRDAHSIHSLSTIKVHSARE
jgi:hypothetical protein